MGKKRLTRAGAKSAAEKLQAYWAERGCAIEVKVVHEGTDYDGNPIWVVRSDMIAGLPREAWARKLSKVEGRS